mgnify:FL=1
MKNKTLKDFSATERFDMVRHVKDTFDDYNMDLKNYHASRMEIYKEVNKTEEDSQNDWDTKFHVNKLAQTENKVTPKIMAKNPRFIVSFKTDIESEEDKSLPIEQKQAKMKGKEELPQAIQDYLNTIYEKQEMRKKIKLFAKAGVRYGIGWGKVNYKVKNGEWYPIIDVKSFADMYFDPRYTTLDEMPALIEIQRSVRISDLEASGKYDQEILDELKEITTTKDPELKRQLIEAIAGIIDSNENPTPDLKNLELKIYEGYYGEDDNFVRLTTVSDYLLIGYEEIDEFSYEEWRVFEDTETFLSKGFLDGGLGLQREMNWKKNAASEYINFALHRTMVMSPNSGIDPAELYAWPWHTIISDSMTAREVIDNHLLELPHRELSVQYFNEQNDMERQFQAATYTIDIANRAPWVGQTNTATGEKIQYAEMDDVTKDARTSFEDALGRLAYKFLQVTYENMDTNIYFERSNWKEYWILHKEAFKDAFRKFKIKVEANSSSSADVESRRADAIAKKNIIAEAVKVGAMTAEQAKDAYIDILKTFEGVDINKLTAPSMLLPQMPTPWMPATPQTPPPANPMAIGNPPTIWSIQ